MDFNIGLETIQQVNFAMLRKKPRFRISSGNLVGLIKLRKQMKTMKRESFKKRYGNLLSLMEVDVKLHVISSLSQYFDSLVKCFTFQNF